MQELGIWMESWYSMKNIRQSNVNTHKDAWVEINLESLAQNIIEIKKGIPSWYSCIRCPSQYNLDGGVPLC